ncbi:MAG TPA: type II toxin-antitoxin system HicA family toxin [Thermoanaerobaculia bacterium]|nr:type II toxin-antitoxin system HicA family toxin [Thermoanaerobaculia bacterium]
MKPEDLLRRCQRGEVRDVSFEDFVRLLRFFRFQLDRVRGRHHVFYRQDLRLRIVVQPLCGQAKPYQVRQLLALVAAYDLRAEF